MAILHHYPANVLETSVFYGNAGLYEDAILLLKEFTGQNGSRESISPLVYYYLGYYAGRLGRTVEMKHYYSQAEMQSPDFVFPFQHEAVNILKDAIEVLPYDAKAPYYLGNLLYDWQPAEAIKQWEKSASLDPNLSIVNRNLALGYANQENDLNKAIKSLEKAVSAEKKYAMHFFELDELYQAAGVSPEKRLEMLETNHEIVNQRDDALSHEIALKIFGDKYQEALDLMKNRQFNVWEGGARFNINDYWTDAYIMLGHSEMKKHNFKKAAEYYKLSIEFPPNLQTARGASSGRFPEASWWAGLAYQAAGDRKKAIREWTEAVANIEERDRLMMNTETLNLFYQAMSLKRLGKTEKSTEIFKRLITAGNNSLKNMDQVDFFEKFGQQQSQRSSLGNTHFIIGLGYLGLDKHAEAEAEFRKALDNCPDHHYSKIFLENKIASFE
jgi:tetratricopeptide (TPR) repeat protein